MLLYSTILAFSFFFSIFNLLDYMMIYRLHVFYFPFFIHSVLTFTLFQIIILSCFRFIFFYFLLSSVCILFLSLTFVLPSFPLNLFILAGFHYFLLSLILVLFSSLHFFIYFYIYIFLFFFLFTKYLFCFYFLSFFFITSFLPHLLFIYLLLSIVIPFFYSFFSYLFL